jgi:hypothetical protein
MNLNVAAIILFSSIATCFAGNFTPVPKSKVVQNIQNCPANCQNNFNLCVRLRGTQFQPIVTPGTTPITPPPTIVAPVQSGIGPNCELDQNFCLRSCQVNPQG